MLLNAANAIIASYRYDAFGGLLAQTGAAVNPLLYRGERFDPVLAQYYLRARFYDPATGRFTKMDPFFGILQDPLSLHRQLYANADPINHVDPSGLFIGGYIAFAGMIAGGIVGLSVGIHAGVTRGGGVWRTVA
jgi:RHS repeat-associated protein